MAIPSCSQCNEAGLLCRDFQNFQQRPAEKMRRVVCFFPVRGTKPGFRWLPRKRLSGALWAVDHRSLLSGEYSGARGLTEEAFPSSSTKMSFSCCLRTTRTLLTKRRSTSPQDPRSGLASIRQLLQSCGRQIEPEHDEDFVSPRDIDAVRDFDQRDYAVLMVYLVRPGDTSQDSSFWLCGPKVEAVCVDCNGDLRTNSRVRAE